jgi:hypothetical protein
MLRVWLLSLPLLVLLQACAGEQAQIAAQAQKPLAEAPASPAASPSTPPSSSTPAAAAKEGGLGCAASPTVFDMWSCVFKKQ